MSDEPVPQVSAVAVLEPVTQVVVTEVDLVVTVVEDAAVMVTAVAEDVSVLTVVEDPIVVIVPTEEDITVLTVGTQGPEGAIGPRGLQGVQGIQGLQGVQGLVGPQGLIGPQGIQGVQGLQGIQGIPGPSGVNYVHTQETPVSIWTITHNLGYRPGGVYAEDSAGNNLEGDVAYPSINVLTIVFSAAFAGIAYLS